MKVLFLVNGSATDADGMRANKLASLLPREWNLRIVFRETSKIQSMKNFLKVGLAFRPDVIISIKMAFSGVLAGLGTKLLLGCKLICETGDAAYALAKSSGRYPFSELALIWTVERLGTHFSDWVVTRGTFHKAMLATWGVDRVTVIPDGIEMTVDSPQDGTPIRDELKLQGEFVVGLIGSMEWSARYQFCYGWDLVEALGKLRDLPVAMLVVGDGSGRPHLEERAEELGVASRIHFVGRMAYAALGPYLGAMDVCLSTQSADIVGMVRTTGKLPLYLAHDKYVIATDVGEARRVLPGIGKLLPYTGVKDVAYPERLASAIRELVKDPRQVCLAGAARSKAASEFDYERLAHRLQTVIEQVNRC